MTQSNQPAVRGIVGVYGLTPEWDDTDKLLQAVTAAAMGGMRALQLRRKLAAPALLRLQATRLQEACKQLGVTFVVNDDWRLALDLGADAVHLGRDDANEATIRQLVEQGLSVGVSCYNDLARVRAAIAAQADTIALGSVYTSDTKPDAVRVSFDTIREARLLCEAAVTNGTRPSVVAIGGIEPGNAAPVAAAGADGLALINGLFASPNSGEAARKTAQAIATGVAAFRAN